MRGNPEPLVYSLPKLPEAVKVTDVQQHQSQAQEQEHQRLKHNSPNQRELEAGAAAWTGQLRGDRQHGQPGPPRLRPCCAQRTTPRLRATQAQ